MKPLIKILLLSIIIGIPQLSQAAVTELEGSFKVGPAIILIAILIIFIAVGIIFRAKDTTDFYAAGRKISPVGAGMAIGSNWMSAASFLGMAALMYGSGYHGLAFVIGWTGGYVLLMVLMAGQIRRYGKYTAADFIGDRYYSNFIRLFGAIMVIIISIAYCVGQFGGIGLMFKWIFGINYFWSVIIGGSVVLIYTLISGMLGATKNMQIQYVILILAFVIPLFFLCFKYDYFWLLPPIGYGAAVSDIVQGIPLPDTINADFLTNVFGHPYSIMPNPEYAMPWDPSTGKSFFEFMAIAFSLMIGTAGLPHVLQRFYVVPNAKDARLSVVWGLFFICVLYWGAPVYAAFGKMLSIHPEVGTLAKDAIVVYTAQLGDVHPLAVGFLAAGAISAAFSTVSGLFVSGASAFSHDIYVKVINPGAKPKNQLFAARIGTILIAIIVTILALQNIGLIGELVAAAFSIAASTLFPLFLLGIWWSGSNRAGGIAGLFMGMLITAISITYFIVAKAGGHLPGQEFVNYYLQLWYFAWIGAPLAIITNIIVSKLTKPTPEHIKEFLATKVHV